jgi:hypothetical protein
MSGTARASGFGLPETGNGAGKPRWSEDSAATGRGIIEWFCRGGGADGASAGVSLFNPNHLEGACTSPIRWAPSPTVLDPARPVFNSLPAAVAMACVVCAPSNAATSAYSDG